MRYEFTTYFVLAAASALQAQSNDIALPAPIPIQQVVYQHWPEQFVQWIGSELPYSMIELYVDAAKGPKPVYDVVLTERSTGKRIHYSNTQFLVDFNKSAGAESYLAAMQLDRPSEGSSERSYYLRFTDHAGRPVLWQFVQGSEVSERGSGLSPAGTQPPVIMYREQSAVAGQGSAVKIGNAVSTADVWTELAQPPYFIPYHGALTENLEIAVFTEGGQKWSTLQRPGKLEKGAVWKMQAEDGHQCTLTVTALQGENVTLAEEDSRRFGQKVTVEARLGNGTWSTKKVHFAPAGTTSSKGITLTFTPGLQPGAQQSKFELFSGTKTRIASGAVNVDQKDLHAGWQFKDPNWLRSKITHAQNNNPTIAVRQ